MKNRMINGLALPILFVVVSLSACNPDRVKPKNLIGKWQATTLVGSFKVAEKSGTLNQNLEKQNSVFEFKDNKTFTNTTEIDVINGVVSTGLVKAGTYEINKNVLTLIYYNKKATSVLKEIYTISIDDDVMIFNANTDQYKEGMASDPLGSAISKQIQSIDITISYRKTL